MIQNMEIILKKKIQPLLIVSFFICLLSINTVQDDLFNIFQHKPKNFFVYLNFFRFIGPNIVILILIFLFSFKNTNKLLILFFFYGLWQIIIFPIENTHSLNYIINYQLILNLFAVLIIFYLADDYDVKLQIKILNILLIFISSISIFFTFRLISEYISNQNLLYLYGTETLLPESKYFDQATPRITGLSRMFLILLYYLFFFQINQENQFLKKISLLISFLLIMGIYAAGTRSGMIGIFILIIYYIFFFKEKLIKKIYFLCLIIIPIITFESIVYLKSNFIFKNYNHLIFKNYNESKYQNNIQIKENRILSNQSSSGRSAIWSTSLKIIKSNKIILGKGPQADRFLLASYVGKDILNREIAVFDNNSSNALIYSYLCGGIISFSLFVGIYFLITKKIFFHFFIQKNLNKQHYITNFSIITLIFLTIRTVFENGYSVFGIDYVLCLNCFFILNKTNQIKS
jgi:hypothetical protein